MIHQDDAIRPPVFPLEVDSGGGPAAEAIGVGVDGSEKQLVGDLIDEAPVDEVQAHKSLPTPVLPSLSERMEHRITHLPYRSWCPECVEAFARERAHKSAMTEERQFPLVSVDYLFLSPKGVILREESQNRWEEPPDGCICVLAGMCSATQALFAFAVPRKGVDADGYAARSLADNVTWLGHSRVALRSDNEPAIVKLVATATNLLKLEGVDVTVEGSVPYDPQSNGAAESAVKRVKGSVRALQLGLENDLRSRVPIGHPVMTWLVRHAAMTRTMHVIGEDGKTAWQRVRGASCKLNLVHFGEVVLYKCRSHEGQIGHSDVRWSTGVWLGVDARTGQHKVFDPDQGGMRHARTIMRKPDIEKFELARIQALSVTPWSVHEPVTSEGVFVEKTVTAPEVSETTIKTRKLYILPKDLEKFGYTPGCKKCQSYIRGTILSSTVQHSEACRQRLMIELAKTDDGRARIARVDVRTDQYLADRVEQGDQRTAQGGIETAVEAPRVNQPLETFEFIPIAKSVSENERFVERVIEMPTENSTNAAVAGSSGDDRRELRVDDHEQAEDIMNDQHVEAANGGGMDWIC